MNKELGLAEVLVLLGGLNLLLGLTVFGARAVAFGVMSLIGAAGLLAWQWKQANDASHTNAFQHPSIGDAERAIKQSARRIGLVPSAWEHGEHESTQSFETNPHHSDPFAVRCTITTTGLSTVQLLPGGSHPQTLFGAVPTGVSIPYGTDEFLVFVKELGAGAAVVPGAPGRFPATFSTPARKPNIREQENEYDLVPVVAAFAESVSDLSPFCHACGHSYAEGEVFCPECGTERREKLTSDTGRRAQGERTFDVVHDRVVGNTAHPLVAVSEDDPVPGRGEFAHPIEGPEAAPVPAAGDASRDTATDGNQDKASHCPNCNSEMLPDALFCINCGTDVSGSESDSGVVDPDATIRRPRK